MTLSHGRIFGARTDLECEYVHHYLVRQSYRIVSTKYYLRALASHRQAVKEVVTARVLAAKEKLEALLCVALLLALRSFITVRDAAERNVPDGQEVRLSCIRTARPAARLSRLPVADCRSSDRLFSDIIMSLVINQNFGKVMHALLPLATQTDFFRLLVGTGYRHDQVNARQPPLQSLNSATPLSKLLIHFVAELEGTCTDPGTSQAYSHAIQTTDTVSTAALQRKRHVPRIQCLNTGIVSLPPEFTTLLCHARPGALAIYAHPQIVQSHEDFKHVWWIGDRDNIQRRICCLTRCLPPGSRRAMSGPLRVAAGDMTLTDLASNISPENDVQVY